MITIVRFTNTKTIYTVVTDCHSRVIASILVNPAPCMNPHHLLRWLMRRLACGTSRSDLPLLPEGDKMCLNKDEVRPILARARVVHVHPRPPPVAPGADHVLEPDVQISMIMILMIRILELRNCEDGLHQQHQCFGHYRCNSTWPTFHLFLFHLSIFSCSIFPSAPGHLAIDAMTRAAVAKMRSTCLRLTRDADFSTFQVNVNIQFLKGKEK